MLARLDAEARLSTIYPRFFARSSAAIDAYSLLLVVNDIFISAKRSVVELGAGWSTFVLASVLKESGGRLVSVEHHEGWHDLIKARLVAEGLADTVDLIRAPLTNGWYGKAGLKDRGIDTLLVDGPPAKGNDIVREPALPFLFSHLAPPPRFFARHRPQGRARDRDRLGRTAGYPPAFPPRQPEAGLVSSTTGVLVQGVTRIPHGGRSFSSLYAYALHQEA